MKFCIFTFCLLFAQICFAQASECLPKLKDLLRTDSEKFLLEAKPGVFDVFKLGCGEAQFGNKLHMTDAFIFIHEAAHFQDLGWDAEMLRKFENNNPTQEEKYEAIKEGLKALNFYSVNNEHLGNFVNYDDLPGVSEIIIPYLETTKPEFLEEDSIYMSMHEGYGADPDSLAAQFIHGLATELNGYTHGARIQARMLPLLPNPVTINDGQGNEYTMENPYSALPSQLDGVMHFLYNFNLYLKLVKEKTPEAFKEFYTTKNREYLRQILSPSVGVLKELDHCSIRNTYENVDFYIIELLKIDHDLLKEVIGHDAFSALTCGEGDVRVGLEFFEQDNRKIQKTGCNS